MSGPPRAAELSVAGRVARWIEGRDPTAREVAGARERSLVRLSAPEGDLLVKCYRPLARWRRLLPGGGAAEREARRLEALREAAVPVPRVHARAEGPDGTALLVLDWIDAPPLEELARRPRAERRRGLAAAGRLLHALHEAGWQHGDLHVGNLLVRGERAVLLDPGRARPDRPGGRFSDLGALDFSLRHHGFGLGDRLTLRLAALGQGEARPGDPLLRPALRRIARESERRARAYWRSRTRRSLRPGRRFAAIHLGRLRGLRLRELPEDRVAEAVAAHAAGPGDPRLEVMKWDHRARIGAVSCGGRSLVVKQVSKGGPGRLLADLFRGSPARRAWLAGHGLAARRIPAAEALAYLEERRFGVPVRSVAVLGDLRPARALAEPDADERGQDLARGLLHLLLALHRAGVHHGDLQALHVYRGSAAGRPGRLIDLEGVRFRRRLADRERIRALAELNASLPDARLAARDRLWAYARYAQALPFAAGARAALGEVVARSLARRHHWKGAGCSGRGDASRGISGGRGPTGSSWTSR